MFGGSNVEWLDQIYDDEFKNKTLLVCFLFVFILVQIQFDLETRRVANIPKKWFNEPNLFFCFR